MLFDKMEWMLKQMLNRWRGVLCSRLKKNEELLLRTYNVEKLISALAKFAIAASSKAYIG